VGHPGTDPAIEPLPFDPATARGLLDEAGWRPEGREAIRHRDGRALRFTLLVPAVSANLQRVASVVQQDMLAAGVRMDIHAVDWAVFLERAGDHDFDAAALMLTLDWETDYYVLFHSSQAEGGMNYGAWEDAEADRILAALRTELDQERRNQLLRSFHRIFHREQPQTVLSARVESSLVHRAIEGTVMGIPWFDERSWWIPEGRRAAGGRPAR
jgi:peptide/nickel transport system substrate-binding protein